MALLLSLMGQSSGRRNRSSTRTVTTTTTTTFNHPQNSHTSTVVTTTTTETTNRDGNTPHSFANSINPQSAPAPSISHSINPNHNLPEPSTPFVPEIVHQIDLPFISEVNAQQSSRSQNQDTICYASFPSPCFQSTPHSSDETKQFAVPIVIKPLTPVFPSNPFTPMTSSSILTCSTPMTPSPILSASVLNDHRTPFCPILMDAWLNV